MSGFFDSWDTFGAYQELYPVQAPLYDGDISPHSVVDPAPRQSIEPWDESTRELRIIISRHPTTTAFLQSAYKEGLKLYGAIAQVAAYVMRGDSRDALTIRVLKGMNFQKREFSDFRDGVV